MMVMLTTATAVVSVAAVMAASLPVGKALVALAAAAFGCSLGYVACALFTAGERADHD